MTEFYFLMRHTPFWAVPTLIVSAEFAYLFWLRKKKHTVKFCLVMFIISAAALGWYYYAGGPDKAVKKFILWQRTLE